MKLKPVKLLIFSSAVAIAGASLSGCLEMPSGSSKGSSSSASEGSGGNGGGAPPTVVEKVDVEKKGQLVNRKYIKALFNEVFNSTTYPNDVNEFYPDWVQGTVIDRHLNMPAYFGSPCEQNSSAGHVDCGSSVMAGISVSVFPQSTGAQQMNMTTLCEYELERPNAIKAAAEKISEVPGGNLNEITAANIPKIFSLFFRQRDIVPGELQAYVTFNAGLAARGKSRTDRWKAVLVMMCESPEWQAL